MNEHLDWNDCAAEYDASRLRITKLIGAADDEELTTTVQACPDWTVLELCAHLAAVPAALVGGDLPGDDTDAWVARQVADRAGRSPSELMDEWAEATPPFQKMMVSAGGQVAGLVVDVVAHEHDLRHAIGRPGARDNRGVQLSLGFTKLIMDRDLARSGGDDIVRFGSDDGIWQSGGDGEPTVTLDLSGRPEGSFSLMRALGSRRSLDQLVELPWEGDWMSARAGIFHMPLPEEPIIE